MRQYLLFDASASLGADVTVGYDRARRVASLWMTPAEIAASQEHHRSPLILQCVEDWLAGRRWPLDLISHYD